MCGIGGILGFEGDRSALAGRLDALCRALKHRGPDSEGVFVSESADCGLVHTRLAILGLAPNGRQPMTIGERRYWITFNGEIYNFRALRSELQSRGCTFTTETDTEVILQLYRLEGPDCVRRLEGMFAFVIWDETEKKGFAARDPFGIKPLYYRLGSKGSFAFASEVKALLQLDATARRLNLNAVLGYLLSGSTPEPETLIQGILSLPAGHRMTWQYGKTAIESYWTPQFPQNAMSWSEAVDRTNAALEASVRRHFVSDVPVGVFLSGGLDSSALVALAARTGLRDLRTFCLRFDEPNYDESPIALRTARHFGYSFETWRLDADTARQVLAEYLNAMDQPSIDGFNTFCVARHARQSGMKVVLSGLGGDELFGGYASFHSIPQIMRGMTILNQLGLQGVASRFFQSRGGPYRRLAAAMQARPDWGIAYWAMRGVFTPAEALTLAKRFVADAGTLPSPEQLLATQGIGGELLAPTARDQVCSLEFSRYLKNQLLRDSDVYSMSWGMELRVPFVDRVLFEAIAPIPSHHRLATGKKLLKAAVPELPSWVTGRRKQGFVVPFARWALSEWNDQLGSTKAQAAVPLTTWYQRWSLFALDQFVSRHGIEIP